jgi:1A family penicillin-binding protein
MKKRRRKPALSILKVFEIIGKPIFFVAKILIITWFLTFELIKGLLQKATPPKLPRFKFPKVRKYTFPKWKLLKRNASVLKYLFVIVMIGACGFLTYQVIFKDLPSVKLLVESPPSLSTKIYDRNDILLYQIYKDENRSLISLSDLPPHVINATLAAEDKNFYHHFGVDPMGITRAAFNNLSCRLQSTYCSDSPQGGSTITQQLVKNTLLTPEKTFTRKIKELILSFATEYTYSKDQILEMYLNQIGYGGTAYGIEEASHEYFGKSAKDLTLAESAMLSGLPIAPTTLSPYGTNPYLSKVRQQQVLESMVAIGSITENDKVEALSVPLVFHAQGITIKAPHFVMYVKDLLVKKYGEDTVARGGLNVKTTLDISIQETLQSEINTELDKLKNLHVQNGAGLVINPTTGEILAMVGSRNFFDSEHDGQVNIALQERQPGSSIKPITYALALSRGLSPSSTIEDSPICFKSKGQPDYCPKNYDGKFHGTVTLKTALASSYNIPAVKLLNAYGLSNMIELARNLGITTWNDPSRFGLSLTLGGGEIKMIDLASVYGVFANGGKKVTLSPITTITDSQGNQLPPYSMSPIPTPEVLSPAIAYQINSMLSDPLARAPAFGMNSVLNLPGKNVAVKTGTTNALRDNWTFGYTKDLLVATWVGNNDNTPMSSVASGITGASPIWARTMQSLLGSTTAEAFTPPENIVRINVSCEGEPRYEYFVKGNTPRIDCSQKLGTLLNTAATTAQ